MYRARLEKQILRGALADAPDTKLDEMLLAARRATMPYQSSTRCFASRLYGSAVGYPPESSVCWRRLIPQPGQERVFAQFLGAERAYYSLIGAHGGFSKDAELLRQRLIIPLIKAELRMRNKRALKQARTQSYFALAEDQAWFWISLSTRPSRPANGTSPAEMMDDLASILDHRCLKI